MHLGACALSDLYPALWEFLTVMSWEDGTARAPGSLSVFFGGYGLQAALNDKDGGLVAFVSGDTLTALLEALDQGIANDALDWRRSVQTNGRNRGKKS
jgi:hypothetical protein